MTTHVHVSSPTRRNHGARGLAPVSHEGNQVAELGRQFVAAGWSCLVQDERHAEYQKGGRLAVIVVRG